jgi:cytochrome c-type biogenesis protein
MEQEVSLLIVFAAGLLSFLSPCVLPLIPGYIAFVTDISITDMTDNNGAGRKSASVMRSSLLFVMGFSLVFVSLGATATSIGSFLTDKIPLLVNIAGIIVIAFGLQQIGIFKFRFMMTTKQINLPANKLGPFKAPLLGAAFAFGWTPCIGPILAAILTYAATMETVKKGVLLLIVYSAGLGIPFLLTTLAMNKFFKIFDRIKQHMDLIQKISGTILVLLGILIITGQLSIIASKLNVLNGLVW